MAESSKLIKKMKKIWNKLMRWIGYHPTEMMVLAD